jgi:calcium-dependent protein kinase
MFDKSGEVKLIDFGLAKQVLDNEKLKTVAGTPYFIAPEVLNGNYGKECDFWSVGVLLFLLVTATYPFDSAAKNRTEVFNKIKSGNYSIPGQIESKLSPECKDILKKLITVDKSKRITGEEALKHAWFENCLKKKGSEVVLLDEQVITKLREFKGSSILKRAALNLFVKMLSSEDVEQLRAQFQSIDKDNSGQIEVAELKDVLAKSNKKVPLEEFEQIIKETDYNGNDKINYSEFLAATLTVQNIMTH